MLYERRHTRMIEAYGGIARAVPLFSAMLVFVTFSSIGVPGTNGFIGEFLVLLGSYRTYPVHAVIATTCVILAAAYLLWSVQRIVFNPLDKPENEHIPDLNRRELWLMAPILAGIIWLGVYPAPVLRRMQPAAEQFVRLVETRAAMPASTAEGVR
jgi:NADH-quinone oxidoreductase subunit M